MVVRPCMTRVRPAEDALFGVGVYAGEGVVEDEDVGVADDGAGDGGALFLAAGEGEAALADHGVEAFGELEDLGGDVGDWWRLLRPARSVASGLPKAMFWRMVSEKRKVSCGTKPMLCAEACERDSCGWGWPSMRTVPGAAS